jgi:hypothetical protein
MGKIHRKLEKNGLNDIYVYNETTLFLGGLWFWAMYRNQLFLLIIDLLTKKIVLFSLPISISKI